MSGADTANTTGIPGSLGTMPPSSTGVGTPAGEWGDKLIAAVNSPTASTGGYATVTGDSPTDALPDSSTPAPNTAAPTSGFNAGLGGEHASGDIPRPTGFNSGVGGEHASGDIPITTKMASLSTGGVDPSSSTFAPVTGGGLATSANVAALPTAGHSEGLTRAELNARKAEQATGKHLEEMSGREQAAAQLGILTGLAAGTSGNITPGKELPGGWGHTEPIPAPGTSASHPTTSIYEDVTHALDRVGQAAFAVVPPSLMDKVRRTSTSDTTTSPSKSGGLFDQAKHILSGSEGVTTTGRRASKSDLPRVPGTAGSDGSVLHQAKGFMQDIVGALREELTGHPTAGGVGGVAGTSGTTAIAPAKSLPSEEPLGAKPGDRSAGVGSLPGLSTETGVAVLPEEKNLPSGVGDLPGGPDETGVAVPPDVKAKEGINGFSSSTGATSGIITGVAEPSSAASEDMLPSSTHVDSPPTNVGSTSATQETLGTGATGGSVPSDSHSSGLAPALGAFVESTPTTSAFSSKTERGFPEAESIGTAIDAKPIEVVPVADEHQSRETGNPALPIEVLSAAGIAGAAGVAGAPISARTERASEDSGRGGTNNGSFASTEPASAIPGHMSGPGHITANDRADSTTSVTAIRHGEPGDLHNKNFRGAGIGLGDGLNDMGQKDLPPTPKPTTTHQADTFNAVSKAPGHASQGVGSADSADAIPTPTDKTTVNSEPHQDVKEEFAAVGHGTTSHPASAIPAKQADATESSAVAGMHGHKRESSTSSSGKKSGFLSKIKAKMHHEK